MRRLRPIGPADELSIVDHLDELRFRVVVAISTFAVAFGLAFWQNDVVLDIVNRPLDGREPITFGVTEPFMTTITVAGYAALLIALPVLLWQLYAFMLPALSGGERRVALPLMLLVPMLFTAGVVFAYYIVLPTAVQFLLGFNPDEFNTQVRAREYYGFVAQSAIAVGVLFQVPVGVLALTRLGIVTPESLRKGRRYAILGMAVAAMLLPGVDPVTMIIEMVPLVILYEVSIVIAAAFGRPAADPADDAAAMGAS